MMIAAIGVARAVVMVAVKDEVKDVATWQKGWSRKVESAAT